MLRKFVRQLSTGVRVAGGGRGHEDRTKGNILPFFKKIQRDEDIVTTETGEKIHLKGEYYTTTRPAGSEELPIPETLFEGKKTYQKPRKTYGPYVGELCKI